MKAIVTTRQGGPEVLELQDVPAPEPKHGEVLINVEAAGLNFADLLSARGRYPGLPEPPYVGGRELAGTIASTGELVMGYTEYGAFAEQVACERHRLWPLPKGWNMAEGAAFPVNFFTAYLAYWKAGLLPGDANRPAGRRPRVLIHAAAGGVGTAAIEIGKLIDVETWGTSSSDAKLQGAIGLGLEHPINYTQQDYEQTVLDATRGEGMDAVFEMLGGVDTAKSIRTLAFNGRCILYGTASGQRPQIDMGALYSKAASVHGLWLSRLSGRRDLMEQAWKTLSGWIEEGKIKPVIGHTMPMSQIAEATRIMGDRKNFGKIVLSVKV